MHKNLRTIGSVGVMLCLSATIAAAQKTIAPRNNSDQQATGISTATTSGAYTPGGNGGGGGGGNNAPVTPGSVANEARAIGSAPGGAQVAAVLGNAPGAGVALGNALTGGGAPAAQVTALTGALGNLGSNPSPAALATAISAYNALIAAAPAGFINNPPAQVAAIKAALLAIRGSK